MTLFQDILSKLSQQLQGSQGDTHHIAQSISECIGIDIDPDCITIKDHSIYLLVSPTIKSTVLLKQKALLQCLKPYSIYSIK